MEDVSYTPIGVVRTPFPHSREAPKRPRVRKNAGTVGVLPRHAEGQADPGSFSLAVLLFHLHLTGADMVDGTPFPDVNSHIPK